LAVSLTWFAGLYLVLQPEKHRAVLFLVVAIEVQVRDDSGEHLQKRIADQVRVKLTSEQHASLTRVHRVNAASLEAYLKGSLFLNQGMGSLDKSVEYFSEAIQLDPANAQAYSGLSQSYLMIGIFGLRPSQEVYPKARAAAMKAIEIDATTADAHGVLAEIAKGHDDWDWAAAESE
jgi:tetratricopeptide (TPR) repeat protein